jgi:protein-S-isoprenylcysteine O-methyltransferase Ste14
MTFFDYFQLAILLAIVIVFITKAVYLRAARNVTAIVIGRSGSIVLRLIEIVALTGLLAWLFEIAAYATHWNAAAVPAGLHRQLLNSSFARVAGVVLVSGGLLLFVLAYLNFGASWRVGIDRASPGALVTKGIFSLTRNPIYVFLDTWFIGTFLINGTLFFLVSAVLAVASQHWQIRREEDFLSERYGAAYEDYRRRTARYVIW